jgi:spore coat protein H
MLKLRTLGPVYFLSAAAVLAMGACGKGKGTPGGVAAGSGMGGEAGSGVGIEELGGTSGAGGAGTFGACQAPETSIGTLPPDELFGLDHVPSFDFFLEPASWEELQRNARDEQYVQVEACFEGQYLGVVGLRFKGGAGTLLSCVDEQGQRSCAKLSMKVKFDEYVDEQLFYGQNKLNLHSMVRDPSHLRERIGYGLFRAMGIEAPRSSWAPARVNGEEQGLFSLVEEVDRRFIRNHFSEEVGDLYKEAWPLSTEAAYYAERIETNESVATHARFIAFAGALADAKTAEQVQAELSTWTDAEQLARYMAVDDVLLNWDGVTAFYTDPTATWRGNHNFYSYFRPSDQRFVLIPWDLDNTLRAGAPMNQVPHWTLQPEQCSTVYPVFGGSARVVAPGCDPLLQGLARDPTGYRAALEELLEGPFALSTLEEELNAYAALLRPAVAADPNGPGPEAFEAELQSLRQELTLLAARAQSLASGEVPVPFSLTGAAVNDFETVSSLELALGMQLLSNPSTTASVAAGSDAPLQGLQDFRLLFDFRNGTEPWAQWINLTASFQEGALDVSARTGVRFTASASGQRVLRVEIDSPAQTATELGIRFGWEVLLGTTPQTYELPFADLAVPAWAVTQGTDPQDDVSSARQAVTGLVLSPQCEGRQADGFLPADTSDTGSIQLDALELY